MNQPTRLALLALALVAGVLVVLVATGRLDPLPLPACDEPRTVTALEEALRRDLITSLLFSEVEILRVRTPQSVAYRRTPPLRTCTARVEATYTPILTVAAVDKVTVTNPYRYTIEWDDRRARTVYVETTRD
jgi:hypothetical protein